MNNDWWKVLNGYFLKRKNVQSFWWPQTPRNLFFFSSLRTQMVARRGFLVRVCVLVAMGSTVSAQTTEASKTIILSGAGTTNPQNYFRTVMEYLTVESKLPVIFVASFVVFSFVLFLILNPNSTDESSLSCCGLQHRVQRVYRRERCNALGGQICGWRWHWNHENQIFSIERFWRWRYSYVRIECISKKIHSDKCFSRAIIHSNATMITVKRLCVFSYFFFVVLSPKDYYDAAKSNNKDRKIMQIPLFLGAIAIFYVSWGLAVILYFLHICHATSHTRTTTTARSPHWSSMDVFWWKSSRVRSKRGTILRSKLWTETTCPRVKSWWCTACTGRAVPRARLSTCARWQSIWIVRRSGLRRWTAEPMLGARSERTVCGSPTGLMLLRRGLLACWPNSGAWRG